eukprot:6247175-Ditylum_brightwellii.AAC.1
MDHQNLEPVTEHLDHASGKHVIWNIAVCMEEYVKKHHNGETKFEQLCFQHINGGDKCFCKYKCCGEVFQHP